MANTVPKGGERPPQYSPDQERFFLGPYPADQVPQDLLTAVRRAVERFQSLDRPG